MSTVLDAASHRDLRAQIETLMADYVHCIDDDRLEELPGYFEEKGRYRVVTRENYELALPVSLIYCDGRNMLADRISALRTANIFEPHVYCHLISSIKLMSVNGDEFTARSNFAIIRTMSEGDASIFASGRYFDRIVKHGDELKFRERVAVLDSRRIDTLLVIPI
jgi:anthranilate 1,2-dioxygenase small subunit